MKLNYNTISIALNEFKLIKVLFEIHIVDSSSIFANMMLDNNKMFFLTLFKKQENSSIMYISGSFEIISLTFLI